jgi:two-component system LytT family sensor kinase
MLNTKLQNSQIIIRHVVVWLIFISYELSYIYLVTGKLGNFWDFTLHYTVNIILLYFNAYCFKMLFNRKHGYLLISIAVLLEIAAYLGVQLLIFRFMALVGIIPRSGISSVKLFVLQGIYRAIYFMGFSIAYWFALSLNKQRIMIQELTHSKLIQERLSAELEKNLMRAKTAYLQSQLNPHLLFNTLNFIYNSVRKLSESAAYSILLLAEMMRYSLSNVGDDGKVSLQKEVDHIGNLVKLNQLRFNEKLNLQINLQGAFEDEKVIPLLLLNFVENVFKHGDLTDTSFPATIFISCEDHTLTMYCFNKQKKNNIHKGWGIGIKNAQTRLNIYYPDVHTIEITDDDVQYKLELMVKLQ